MTSVTMAIALGFYTYGIRFLHASLFQFVAYFFMRIFPRDMQHTMTISVGLIVTLLNHLYVYYIPGNEFNLASCLMASFVRQYVISINYYDGGVDSSKLSSRQ